MQIKCRETSPDQCSHLGRYASRTLRNTLSKCAVKSQGRSSERRECSETKSAKCRNRRQVRGRGAHTQRERERGDPNSRDIHPYDGTCVIPNSRSRGARIQMGRNERSARGGAQKCTARGGRLQCYRYGRTVELQNRETGGKAGDGRKGGVEAEEEEEEEEEEGAREGRNGMREEERQGARSSAM